MRSLYIWGLSARILGHSKSGICARILGHSKSGTSSSHMSHLPVTNPGKTRTLNTISHTYLSEIEEGAFQ